MNIGISGPVGAGKTTAARYLSISYGLSYLRYSEILAEMLGQEKTNRSALRDFGWQVMSSGQQKILNEMLLSMMTIGTDHVIDGLRHPVDLETLSSQSDQPFYLLYVDASPTIRWPRVKGRDGFQSWEEFKAHDCHEVESKLPYLKEKAYKVLLNEGTSQALEFKLDQVISEIQGSV